LSKLQESPFYFVLNLPCLTFISAWKSPSGSSNDHDSDRDPARIFIIQKVDSIIRLFLEKNSDEKVYSLAFGQIDLVITLQLIGRYFVRAR